MQVELVSQELNKSILHEAHISADLGVHAGNSEEAGGAGERVR